MQIYEGRVLRTEGTEGTKPSNGNELAMSKEKKDGRCLEGSVNNKKNGGRG